MAQDFRYYAPCCGEEQRLVNAYYGDDARGRYVPFGRCPSCQQLHQAARVIRYKANPSRHECNGKCMGASGKHMACECRCGGKNHGVGSAVAA